MLIKLLEFNRDDRPTGRVWFVLFSAALPLTALAGCGQRSTLDDGLVSSIDNVPAVAEIGEQLSQAGALVGASDHGTTEALYGRDPDGIDFEAAWLATGDLITPDTVP